MAYPKLRSCLASMYRGMVDGKYKFAAPNRGGVVENTYAPMRAEMSGAWHGFEETQPKVLPDGRIVSTVYSAPVAPMDRENI